MDEPRLRIDQQWQCPGVAVRLLVAGDGDGMAELIAALTPVIESIEAFVAARPGGDGGGEG